jgi:hypothetical protein
MFKIWSRIFGASILYYRSPYYTILPSGKLT